MKEIKERLNEITEARECFRLREEDGKRCSSFPVNYVPPTSHHVKSTVYGRDIDKEKVIELLLSKDNPSFSVTCIFGKGGLGKTTLAQLVFNEFNKVPQEFDYKVWVHVSEDFDVVKLARTVIEDLRTTSSSDVDQLSQLQKILDKELEGKKLLLVLDDVWNDRANLWEHFKGLFAQASTVRVLVTTRNDSVVKAMDNCNQYCLDLLPETECRKLFENYAFDGRGSSKFPNLVGEILKKCGGLPLAVKSLGSLLRHENDEDTWNDVLQSELWELPDRAEILPALILSYKRMPSYLKPCFSYCSIFPRGYKFDRYKIVKLWMAQGYIVPRNGKRMEAIGNDYVNELLSRSLFDSSRGQYWMHDVVHDLAKHVSRGECGALIYGNNYEKDNLSELRHLYLDGRTGGNNTIKPDMLRTFFYNKYYIESNLTERLKRSESFQRYPDVVYRIDSKFTERLMRLRAMEIFGHPSFQFLNVIVKLKHLRHLCIQNSRIAALPESLCCLYKLRTLQLCHNRIEYLPDEFGNLVSLQMLIIREYCFKQLPNSIGKLYNLEVLILEACVGLKELPNTFGDLCNLYHLNISCSKVNSLPDRFWMLKKMETLYTGSVKVNGIEGLENFTNLKTPLCICGLQNVINIDEVKRANLSRKPRIDTLKFFWGNMSCNNKHHLHIEIVKCDEKSNQDGLYEKDEVMLEYLRPHSNVKFLEIHDYPGCRYPSWMRDSSFIKLTHVVLNGCKTPCLPSLGELPSLEALEIKQCLVKSIANEFYCSNSDNIRDTVRRTAFPSLKKLELNSLSELEEWYGAVDGDFPRLEMLTVKFCNRLRRLPDTPSVYGLSSSNLPLRR